MRDLTLYPFEVRPLTKEDGGGYFISFPDFSKCISDGETPEEAIRNGMDALAETIAALDVLEITRARQQSNEDAMNDPVVPYRIGLLEDLADPEEAMAYLEAALEDGDQQVIQMGLQDVVDAQKSSHDDDDLRFSPEGWLRFQALMTQAEESIRTGKTLSSDEFWRQAYQRADAPAVS